ncbi:MAG: signal peptidase I [Candidatus Promineifilaceae bacterium]
MIHYPEAAGPPAPSPTETRPRPRRQPSANLLREIVETLLLMAFMMWLVNTATGRFRIEGYSMLPTLKEGEYVIINKLAYHLDEPERGDIIVLHFPNDRSRDFIKRVVGLPGDQVQVQDGVVRVNGRVLDEPYINAQPSYDGSWQVPAGEYFVLGDNRNNSSDSHNWQFLPRQDIVGKAWVIYWGPEDWGLVPHYQHAI